jgi:hypothetical protein
MTNEEGLCDLDLVPTGAFLWPTLYQINYPFICPCRGWDGGCGEAAGISFCWVHTNVERDRLISLINLFNYVSNEIYQLLLASVMADLCYVAAIHCVSKVLFLHKLCSFRKQQ